MAAAATGEAPTNALHAMPRRYWYIAAPTLRLGAAPLACRVFDLDLVLFRQPGGKPFALHDRCCHRGAKLSLGQVEEGALACGYHGWRYDGAGVCVHIPSLPGNEQLPPGAAVRAFPCVQQDGYIWVWLDEGPPSPAAPPRIPDFHLLAWQQGTLPMACAATLGIENNLDWCHPYFVHVGTHGQYFTTQREGFREQTYETRLLDEGMIVFGPATAQESDPIPAQFWVKSEFKLPNRVTVDFPGEPGMCVILHFVPTGTGACRLEWLFSRPADDGPRLRLTKESPKILTQDRDLLETAQGNYDREGAAFERSVAADASTLLARRIIALAVEGRWPADRATLPPRLVVTVRA